MALPCSFILGTSLALGTSPLDASGLSIEGRGTAPNLLPTHGCYDGKFSVGIYFLVAVQVLERPCFERNLKGSKISNL